MMPPDRREGLAAFYATHHQRVKSIVASRARGADDDLVAEACAFAWMSLVRRDDVQLNDSGAAWVSTVAVRHAWLLLRRQLVEQLSGSWASRPGLGEVREPEAETGDPVARVIALEEHRERVRRFANAKPYERRKLLLKAAGFRYAEIADLSRCTYTAVNRHLTEGRQRIFAAA
jgi:DNA-directed RNA polymerase specialized sigma24 family protein